MPRVPKPAPPAAYATAGFLPLARRYGVAPATVRAWLEAASIEVRAKCHRPECRGRLTVAERSALGATGLTVVPLAERALRGEVMVVQVLAAMRAVLT